MFKASWLLACALMLGVHGGAVQSPLPSPPEKQLQKAFPLQVWPTTVYFTRGLTLDHFEFASLTMKFAISDTSSAPLCEISAIGVLDAAGIERSAPFTIYKKLNAGESRYEEVEISLSHSNKEDNVLMTLPLDQMTIHWVTQEVKGCDGTIYRPGNTPMPAASL